MEKDKPQQKESQQTKVSVTTDPPQKDASGVFSVRAMAIVSLGAKTLHGVRVQFFLDSREEGVAAQTDENGRISIDVTLPAGKKSCSIEAQVVGEIARARTIVDIPDTEKKKREPAKFVINPRRVGNAIWFHVRVVDAEHRTVADAKLSIFIFSKNGKESHLVNAKDGEYVHELNLEPGKEYEVMIGVVGCGARVFRRTFRGK